MATVISLHEDLEMEDADTKYMMDIRAHTLNVLKQLSKQSNKSPLGSVSLISVRFNLKSDDSYIDYGFEGSSNLFYYLFDNWSGTYNLLVSNRNHLEKLVSAA